MTKTTNEVSPKPWPKGAKRLIGNSGPLSVPEIDTLAAEFAHGRIERNNLLHGRLK